MKKLLLILAVFAGTSLHTLQAQVSVQSTNDIATFEDLQYAQQCLSGLSGLTTAVDRANKDLVDKEANAPSHFIPGYVMYGAEDKSAYEKLYDAIYSSLNGNPSDDFTMYFSRSGQVVKIASDALTEDEATKASLTKVVYKKSDDANGNISSGGFVSLSGINLAGGRGGVSTSKELTVNLYTHDQQGVTYKTVTIPVSAYSDETYFEGETIDLVGIILYVSDETKSFETVQEKVEQDIVNDLYTQWVSDRDSMRAAVDSLGAQLETSKKFKNLFITADIDNVSDDFSFTGIDSLASIQGGGHIISFENSDADYSSSLLGNGSSCVVNNLGVKNGSIRDLKTEDTPLSFSSWDNPQASTWRVADAEGAVTSKNSLTFEMGYGVRNAFGVTKDADGNVSFTSLTDNSRVYKAVYYDYDQKSCEETAQTFYTIVDGNGEGGSNSLVLDNTAGSALGFDPATSLAKNGFVYVSDTDADHDKPISYIPNVVTFDTNGQRLCRKANIVDEKETPIYIKYDFTADSLAYTRVFSSTGNEVTVCLPFALTRNDIETNIVNGRGENGGIIKLMTFDKYEDNTFWFQYQSDGVPANVPCVLRFSMNTNQGPSNSTLFAQLSGRSVVATPEGELVKDEEHNMLKGTYIKKEAQELEDNGKYAIYGFSGGKFLRATENSYFAPMRAYLALPVESTTQSAQTLSIGYIDEDGNKVVNGGTTTGLSATTSADGFKVVGTSGAVEITSDRSCDVKIYATTGKLVKSLHVEAGKTSVPVEMGTYVVNGTKVIVK